MLKRPLFIALLISVVCSGLGSSLHALGPSGETESPAKDDGKQKEEITGDFCELTRQFRRHYERMDFEKALRITQKMLEERPDDLGATYNMACLHCLLGHKEQAYTWLQKAVDAGYANDKHLVNDWDFKTIRAEDRFREIVRQIRDWNKEAESPNGRGAVAAQDTKREEAAGSAPEIDATPVAVKATRQAAESILDGKKRSFVIVGNSTSLAWPTMLQDMLDAHSGGDRLYHVLNAAVADTSVRTWIAEPETVACKTTFEAMVTDYFEQDARLRTDAPQPTVALCQQTLQTTRTHKGPVRAADDVEGIRLGADALESLATRLREQGIERVYIAMHIYKQGYEPEVGNERFALKAVLARGHDFFAEGPDVWSLTASRHPSAFADDGQHPNEDGAKIMAEAWYRTIAGSSAREDVIEAMHDRDYDVDKVSREYRRWRKEGNPKKREFFARLGPNSEKVKVVDGRTYLWAAAGRGGSFKWYDFTDAPMPVEYLQYGIGKDAVRAIDDPFFVMPDDPRLLEFPTSPYRPDERPEENDEIMVIGYTHGDDARAYPAALLDCHELVNDSVGGAAVTIGWSPLVNLSVVHGRENGKGTDEFGASGYAYKDVCLILDRETESLWYPLDDKQWTDVSGPRKGETIPFLETPTPVPLGEWLEKHPKTRVLLGPEHRWGNRKVWH